MSQPSAAAALDAAALATVTAKIRVINYYSSAKKFYIFQDLPEPDNGPSKKPFANVYLCSPAVPGDKSGLSSTEFQISSTYYAIFGTNQGVGNNVIIKTSSAKQVKKLGPDGDVYAMSVSGGAPLWDTVTVKEKKTPQNGAFQFWTDGSFVVPNKNNIYIGVGAQDPVGGGVVPIQTWQAEPTLNSILYPKITYYVCTGEYEPGKAVDKQTIGQWCKLEFEGASIPEAVINFTPNGMFTDHDDNTVNNGVDLSTGMN